MANRKRIPCKTLSTTLAMPTRPTEQIVTSSAVGSVKFRMCNDCKERLIDRSTNSLVCPVCGLIYRRWP